MPSLHKQVNKPYWFCAFTTPDAKRHFKSTGTENKSHANKICAGWVKAAELAGQQNLTPDRARQLIEATVADVSESFFSGTMKSETLKNFFEVAAKLVDQPGFSKEQLNKLVSRTVRQVAATVGETIPNATIRDWSKRWLENKALETAPRTHERYETSLRRFLQTLGTKADKDLSSIRVEDIIRFRDNTAKILSTTSANMDLKVVRACLYSAQRQDLINANVATKVSTIKQRGENHRRGFTLGEIRQVLKQCDPHPDFPGIKTGKML